MCIRDSTKSVKRIVLENLFSFFNLIFFIIAGFLIAVGSFGELIFLLVVAANTAIGIIQELHAKKKLDALSLLSAPRAQVIRDSKVTTIPTADLVKDDLVVLSAGNQIAADAKVVSGSVQVNESLITGESDEISKGVGSELLSGSFVDVYKRQGLGRGTGPAEGRLGLPGTQGQDGLPGPLRKDGDLGGQGCHSGFLREWAGAAPWGAPLLYCICIEKGSVSNVRHQDH